MKKYTVVLGTLLGAAMLYGATTMAYPWTRPWPHKTLDSIVQFGTFDQLNRGVYDGTLKTREVAAAGDFGIGTFIGLDGEMVVLDGVVYHAPADGKLYPAKPDHLVPFATVTKFRAETKLLPPGPLADYPAVQAFLTSSMPDPLQMLAFKIHGTMKSIKIRAPQKQVPPYLPLTEALKTQAVFDLTNVSGTMVGYRLPQYIGSVNAPGYHFHFVTDDRKTGGHVLEVSTGAIVVEAQTIERLDVTVGVPD